MQLEAIFLAVLLVNVLPRPHLVEAFRTFHVSVNCDRKSKQAINENRMITISM